MSKTSYIFNFWGSVEEPQPQQEVQNKPTTILDELKNFQKNGKLKTAVRREIVVPRNPVWEEVLEKRNSIINKIIVEKDKAVENDDVENDVEAVENVDVEAVENVKIEEKLEEIYNMLKEVNEKLDYLFKIR